MEKTVRKSWWHNIVLLAMMGQILIDKSVLFYPYGLFTPYLIVLVYILFFIYSLDIVIGQIKSSGTCMKDFSQAYRICHLTTLILSACYIVVFLFFGIKDLLKII